MIEPDSMYPNAGDWYARPEEDVKLEQDQTRKLNSAKPLVRDVIKRLQQRIDFYKDVDNNPVPLEEDNDVHQKYTWCYKEMRKILQDEKEFIESMLK